MYNEIASNKRRTWILILIFIAIICAIGYLIGYVTNYGNGLIIVALVFSIIMALFGYFGGDKVALATAGASEITREENPYVYNMVENLCIAGGLPMPRIYIIDSKAINAFATGRDPRHASIAITAGAIEKLQNEELEGVIAHELSHVKNFDIRIMTIVIILVGMISIIADWFVRASIFGRRGNSEREGGGAILAIIGVILIVLSPLIAQLIKLAISRRREYLADASGALLTRYPDGLANALEKIEKDSSRLETATAATAHLYISNPFKNRGQFLSALFSTHPPIEERIKRLRQMGI